MHAAEFHRRPALALFAGLLLLSSAAIAAAADEPWTLGSGLTSIEFNQHVLGDLGLEVASEQTGTRSGHYYRLDFEVAADSPALLVEAPRGSFERLAGGALRHDGGFELRWDGGFQPLQNFELHPSPKLYTFALRSADGSEVFVMDYPHVRYLPARHELTFLNMDLRISQEFASRLGRPELEGFAVGEAHLVAPVGAGAPPPLTPACTPDFAGDIDIELTLIDNVSEIYHDASRVALAPSAQLSNVGTADVPWYQSIAPDSASGQSTVGQHPYLAMHLYRKVGGTIRQIGRADLKHAFFSGNTGCPCQADQILFVGCDDLYGTSTNAWQSRLAPREELTASTGDWASLSSHFDGSPVDDYRHHNGSDHSSSFAHRLAMDNDELLVPGADYFIEAWYLAKDDIDIFNSMAFREITPTQGIPWIFPFADSGLTLGPAVGAWVNHDSPPAGASSSTVESDDGHLRLAVKTKLLPDGFHHYELALMNLDFDRQIRSLTLTLPDGGLVRDLQFGDVDDDGGNDWQPTGGASDVSWSTAAGDPAQNALDWGTLFNFGFDANVAPADGVVSLGVLEAGSPTTLAPAAKVPGGTVTPAHLVSVTIAGGGSVGSATGGIDCGSDCEEPYLAGAPVSLTGQPDTGAQVAHWQEGASIVTEATSFGFQIAADRNLTATFEPCPAERVLAPAIVSSSLAFETCNALVVGAGFGVSGGAGDLSLTAGDRVELRSGFFVSAGASLTMTIDPSLLAAP